MRLFALSAILLSIQQGLASQDGGGIHPAGLAPLISRANILLSTGQFGEAVKIYTEAIDQSPQDYLLYYKRATAYLSLRRHPAALEDFDTVLKLTHGTFDAAHLHKARIFTTEGAYESARSALEAYNGTESEASDLKETIALGEKERLDVESARREGQWESCIEKASSALRISPHDIEVRKWRSECALASGDIESSVGDLTRLSHLLSPSTPLLTHIFRLSFFLLPPSPGPMNTLKQCLHYDPDSKSCLKLHRLVKAFDKSFAKLDEMLDREDWRGIAKLLLSPKGGRNGELWRKWEEAMLENVGVDDHVLPLVPEDILTPSTGTLAPVTLPLATKVSPQRQKLVRSLCKSYIHISTNSRSTEYRAQMDKWCEELLTLSGCQEDVDGLVGRGEGLLAKEEWEEAVRVFERAFEAGGKSDRDVHSRLTKAQKLLKQSRQKDYYKIVGVARDADERTIKKAYRKAAKAAHPDKGGSEEKMANLNEAYEVLSNPELRARFDAGEDPMDPMAQQGGHPFAQGFGGGGGHPFAQFFQQGQGFGGHQQGGFQFRYSHGH